MLYYLKSFVALVVLAMSMGSAAADDNPLAVLPVLSKPGVSENADNPKTLVELAVKYEHAEGVTRDYPMAVALYCRAARLGNADAQYALGWMYANGRGVSKDDGVAAQLFAMADEQGHEHARKMARYTQSSATLTPLPACLLPEKVIVLEKEDEHDNKAGLEREAGSEKVAGNDDGNSINDDYVYQKGPIFKLVQQLAPRYGVDPRLAMAVISVESGFNVRAVSPKNAQGLMQLIPETAQRFRVKNTFDAKENIQGGLAYLQWLLAFFKGDVSLVAAAYNAGERTVEKYRGIPPYPETQGYVRKITRLYKTPSHPYRANLVEASTFVALPMSYGK